ncbi:cytochrome P450 family protein [Saccharopolyspora phatthalungensis]|uniref:Cytochrome P450 n=1 Tax=Saccharopolyspora phatthalungensis TaxID=664693 RepID=A0A840QBX8_9PSEU|nr:cytochrome P450 [Saccharopolyspora phatthalungensis]MBB5157311.1 cytochrome P450 [Saccharopolyspora phatthalungensis]
MSSKCPVADLYSHDYFHNPYPTLTSFREAGPAHRVLRPDGLETWLITRYGEAQAALSDLRLSMDGRRVQQALGAFAYGFLDRESDPPRTLLSSDPPDHTRLRRLVNRTFTARRIEGMRPVVQRIVDGLLDAIAPLGSADLVSTVAATVPIEVICELLGVPVEDCESFKQWTTALFLPNSDSGDGMTATDGMRNLRKYLSELIAVKRTELGDAQSDGQGLLAALIDVRDHDEDRLSEHELVSMAVQLLIAGHETTVNGISNAVLNLLRSPDQLSLLREDPSLLPQAVEELLRFDGPLETAILRVATEDIPIGNQVIPEGALVKIVLASANRDPEVFDEPDTLDITRTGTRHLQFGHGIHNCLGSYLARMEIEIAVRSLLARFPDLALAVPTEEIRWREIMIMRSLVALPVVFTPQRTNSLSVA